MEYKAKLDAIVSNKGLSLKMKSRLIESLNQTLRMHLKAKSQSNKSSEFKELAEKFSTCYKTIHNKIISIQQKSLSEHRQCLINLNNKESELMHDPTQQYVGNSKQFEEHRNNEIICMNKINSNLSNLLKEIIIKKETLQELTSNIEDHFKFKKAKLQVQFQKKVSNINNKKHPKPTEEKQPLLEKPCNQENQLNSSNLCFQ